MATYSEMVTKVRDWSNRDAEVLSDSNVNDFLEYAADDCYRLLRIPPLEHVHRYTVSGAGDLLTIPEDLSEFIELRQVLTTGLTGYEVYQAKNDIRSFHDPYVQSGTDGYFRWTRQQNCIIVHPSYSDGDVFELFYYRRLSDLNAQYDVNVDNYTAGFLTYTADAPMTATDVYAGLYFPTGTTAAQAQAMTDADGNALVPTAAETTDNTQVFYFQGQEADNWLRDRHDRTLLFGALSYAFTYLNELESQQIYRGKFMEEIEKLNKEEDMRRALGGNIQVLFNTGGLI